ncbi:MAG: hypothetical protein AAGJ97_07085, partial [Planctomycetota bacterium]
MHRVLRAATLFAGGLTAVAHAAPVTYTATIVARTGQTAPGTGGANFRFFSDRYSLNAAGETAFVGSLTGPGVSFSNARGIFS